MWPKKWCVWILKIHGSGLVPPVSVYIQIHPKVFDSMKPSPLNNLNTGPRIHQNVDLSNVFGGRFSNRDPQPSQFVFFSSFWGKWDKIIYTDWEMSDSLERDMKHVIIVIIKLNMYSNDNFFASEIKTKANVFQTFLFFCHFRSLSPVGICIWKIVAKSSCFLMFHFNFSFNTFFPNRLKRTTKRTLMKIPTKFKSKVKFQSIHASIQ